MNLQYEIAMVAMVGTRPSVPGLQSKTYDGPYFPGSTIATIAESHCKSHAEAERFLAAKASGSCA